MMLSLCITAQRTFPVMDYKQCMRSHLHDNNNSGYEVQQSGVQTLWTDWQCSNASMWMLNCNSNEHPRYTHTIPKQFNEFTNRLLLFSVEWRHWSTCVKLQSIVFMEIYMTAVLQYYIPLMYTTVCLQLVRCVCCLCILVYLWFFSYYCDRTQSPFWCSDRTSLDVWQSARM